MVTLGGEEAKQTKAVAEESGGREREIKSRREAEAGLSCFRVFVTAGILKSDRTDNIVSPERQVQEEQKRGMPSKSQRSSRSDQIFNT